MSRVTWTPPPTYELASPDGRVLQYCLYGAPNGLPVIAQHGTPGSRWERPDVVAAINDTGLRMLVAGRPGFGSTRRAGRSVADVAEDVHQLADAQGWWAACVGLRGVAARPRDPVRHDRRDRAGRRTRARAGLGRGRPTRGFEVGAIRVPVDVWYGSEDTNSTIEHAEWILANVPGAVGHEYQGGHDPDDSVQRAIFQSLLG